MIMKAKEFIQAISDKLAVNADVDKVYGKPVKHGKKTIIPVAEVSYSFGGGYGEGDKDAATDKNKRQGEGGGGGGHVRSYPIGVLEITDDESRFIQVDQQSRLLKFLGFGILTGLIVSRLFR